MAKQKNADQPPLLPGFRTPKEAFRDLRNYLAGQVVGATRDETLLDELLKVLFCKLYIERGIADPAEPNSDAFQVANHVRTVFGKVRLDFRDIYPDGTEILLDPQAICRILEVCDFSLTEAAGDPIGDAFEVFIGSEARGRSGQFFTPRPVTDLLVEALAPTPDETVIDPACGAGGFLTAVARHFHANGVPPAAIAEYSSCNSYGIDKDDYLAKLARMHVALLTGGHPRIYCGDSLAMQNGNGGLDRDLPERGFDVLLTNPPFGAKIVAAKPEVLRKFDLARRWRPEPRTGRLQPTGDFLRQVPPQVLFVERCLALLRDGGRLGMVVPESLLSNKSYRHVVEFILTNADVEAVIGMPEALFKTSGKGGTHTKTCLLIASKRSGVVAARPIFMAEARWCGNDSRGRLIPNNDLPTILDNLKTAKRGETLKDSTLGFLLERDAVSSNVLCPRYYDPQLNEELATLEATHELHTFRELVTSGSLSVTTGDELGKLAYGTGDVPFIRTSDISNWELKADPKHGVDHKLYEAIKSKQDVRPHDILMVKDGTYLIGTCAIVSELDVEIIYQSHLYKIRVNPNSLGLDPFLLLAILSCPIVQRQIRSKQFTQDIIDSLGERINELVIPVPRNVASRKRISKMVSDAMRQRVKARQLAKKARQIVAPSNGERQVQPLSS